MMILLGVIAAMIIYWSVTREIKTPPTYPRNQKKTINRTSSVNIQKTSHVSPTFHVNREPAPYSPSNPVYKFKPLTTKITAPEERDNHLREFSVVNPEGEVHCINTADKSSLFYGPVWTRILDAYTKGEFVRGRASMRRMSGIEDRFSGYSVNIGGVEAFLPASKAALFHDPERDATRKCIALKVDTIYPNGLKAGNIIVNAFSPLKHILQQKNNTKQGSTLYALALDYDDEHLLFPLYQPKMICVPLQETMDIARQCGIDPDPDFLTGLYWQIQITSPRAEIQTAKALSVLF